MATIRDYSSIYTIKEFYLNEIAPKYFDLDTVSLLNAGLFGMVTDISGTVTEDQFEVVDRYINEIMPAKAELPDFIYANAALYGISEIFARCAKMPFVLFIKESDVINNGAWGNDQHTFVIDADLLAYIDDLPYSISQDIIISSVKYRGVYNHRAYYAETMTNDLSEELNPYIKLFKMESNGDMYIGLRINLYQYIRRKYTESIITNSILNIPYLEMDYSDQLCNFEVFYQEFGSNTKLQLEKRLETSVPVTTPFVYFKLIDETKIRLSFANDDRYFVPNYNSTIIIYMYETKGVDGNFEYIDNIEATVTFSSDDESRAYNKNIMPFGMMKGDSKGGRSQLNTEEIKRLTLEKLVSLGSYTTDVDLNLHFLNFASVYHNDAMFIKYRDDYAGREYGCFTRLTDGTDIYPTNTLDLRIGVDQVDNHFESLRQYIIKPGSRYGYLNDTELGIVTKIPGVDPEQLIEYTTMALMVITLRPNSVNYYMTSVNKTVDLDYNYMNIKSIFNFLVGNCKISRNAILGEMAYKISLDLKRVDGVTTVINGDDEVNTIELDPTKLKVLMVFNTNSGHYVELSYNSYDENTMIYNFGISLETSDMIDDQRISILNLVSRADANVEERIVNMYNPDITFAVFYDYTTDNITHEYADIKAVGSHTLCNTYKPLEDEFYFAYPLTLTRSHVMFEEELTSDAGWRFYVKQVPLFGKKFLLELDDTTPLIESIVDQHEFLMDTLTDITAAFTINMKFYNTYGRSKLFHLANTDTLLNRVHCNMKLQIKFYDGVIVDDYLYRVKVYIKKFIEVLNMLNDGANKLHISVLIQSLHNEFEQIEHIVFESINGYDSGIQNVELKSVLKEQVNPNTVPEFLTIKESDIEITTI
jgi:hypothetical protein